MDADQFRESIEYELLTKNVYQAILTAEGVTNIDVRHNQGVVGKSGVEHQIDVMWRFRQAGVEHTVLIECKNFSSRLTLEKVRNFFAVIHDIGNCNGIMVTKVGYQDGARRFAEYYGISLKTLRPPTEADWSGRVRSIHLNYVIRCVTDTTPVEIEFVFQPLLAELEARIRDLQAAGGPNIPGDLVPDMYLVNKSGEPVTEPFRVWLPKQIPALSLAPGVHELGLVVPSNSYIRLFESADPDLVIPVVGIMASFTIAEDTVSYIIDGTSIVEAFLADFISGEVEHVQRRGGKVTGNSNTAVPGEI